MRPKVLFYALGAAGIVLGAAIYYHNLPAALEPEATPTTAPAASATPESAAEPPEPSAPRLAYAVHRDADIPSAGSESVAQEPQESREEYATRIETQLAELGASGDPASLKAIVTQLNNADPNIRQAALSATLQLDNPDAIPALQNQMMFTDDLEEKLALQKAIDFLQLPSL